MALTPKNSLAEETKSSSQEHDCATEGSCGSGWPVREASCRMGSARRSRAGSAVLGGVNSRCRAQRGARVWQARRAQRSPRVCRAPPPPCQQETNDPEVGLARLQVSHAWEVSWKAVRSEPEEEALGPADGK